jgi:hypothetical protein
VDAFFNESHKIKYSNDVDYDKIIASETRVKTIEGVDLYDPVQATKICPVLNVFIPKKFHVSEFIKYTGT